MDMQEIITTIDGMTKECAGLVERLRALRNDVVALADTTSKSRTRPRPERAAPDTYKRLVPPLLRAVLRQGPSGVSTMDLSRTLHVSSEMALRIARQLADDKGVVRVGRPYDRRGGTFHVCFAEGKEQDARALLKEYEVAARSERATNGASEVEECTRS